MNCCSLSAVGFFLYLPDMHSLIAHSPRIPYQRELLELNEQCLALLVLLTFIVALLVKVIEHHLIMLFLFKVAFNTSIVFIVL